MFSEHYATYTGLMRFFVVVVVFTIILQSQITQGHCPWEIWWWLLFAYLLFLGTNVTGFQLFLKKMFFSIISKYQCAKIFFMYQYKENVCKYSHQSFPCNRTDTHRSCMQHNFRQRMLFPSWFSFVPCGSLSILCYVCLIHSLADFKETVGVVVERLAHWLCHLFLLSNHQLLLSKCYNHQEAGIEMPTFDLILHRSITASLAPGFYVLRLT